MKTVAAVISLIALFALSHAADASRASDFATAVLDQQSESSLLHPLASLFQGQDVEKQSEKGAYALVKYIVKPSKAKGFIEAFESSKDAAKKYEGYEGYYLVKTVDDNITYVSWAAWKSVEDLAAFIKSDDARELIEYLEKEDIVVLISGVRPIA